MWREFCQAKDNWIGGELEHINTFTSTILTDIYYLEGVVVFTGETIIVSVQENDINIRISGPRFFEFEIIGSNSRWRLTLPKSVQSVVNPEQLANQDKSVLTQTK